MNSTWRKATGFSSFVFRLLPILLCIFVFLILASSTILHTMPSATACTLPRNEIATDKNLPLGSEMTLDSTLFDIQGTPLSYEWFGPFSPACMPEPTLYIPEGTHAVSLLTDDGFHRSGPYVLYITVDPAFSISTCAKKGKAVITWSQVHGAGRYAVYRAKEGAPSQFVKIADLPASITTYTDSGLNDSTYLYTVGTLSNGHWLYSRVKGVHPYLTIPLYNYPPVIYSAPVTKGIAGLPYTYDVQATDPLGDTLTYYLVCPPQGMKIDASSGLIEWTPPALGDYEISVKVKDCKGSYKMQKFIIEVDELPDINHNPIAHAGGPYSSEPNQPVSFNGSASYDPDGDPLQYSWSFGDGSSGTGVSASHAYGTPGTYPITLTVTDGRCGSATDTTTANVMQCLKPTVTLSADPAGISSGEVCSLVWTTQNAQSNSIDNGIGAVGASGSIMVHPQATTTYTITATGTCGTATRSATVIVRQPPTAHIAATPASIVKGRTTQLSWTTTHADTITIDQGIGSVTPNGSLTISPATTTTYTITASGPDGTVTDSVTVVVYQPPTVKIYASLLSIITGQTSQLSWTSTNADTISIDQGIGPVIPIGSFLASPTITTTYTITATGPGGTATDSVTITVYQPPHVSISAQPQTIIEGESATLTWTSEYADTGFLDNGIGSVEVNNSLTISPANTATYTITVQGPGGTATASATVSVIHKPTVIIIASPDHINAGETTTLTWSSTNADSALIDNEIGDVGVNDSLDVELAETTTFIITVAGPGGTATASVKVEVSQPQRKTCAYITNNFADDVSVIDLETNTVKTRIPVGTAPYGVAVSPDGDKVYVACKGDGIYIIDANTNMVVDTIDTYADTLAVSPDGSILYAVSTDVGTLTAINAKTYEIINVVDLGALPHGIAVSLDGSIIYVTSLENGKMWVIDASSLTTIDTIELIPWNGAINDVAVSPDGSRVYAIAADSCILFVLDTKTHSIINWRDYLGERRLSDAYLTVSPDGSKISLSFIKYGEGYIYIIDTQSLEVTNILTPGEPSDISFSPDGSFVYAPDYNFNSVMVIDTESGTVSSTIGEGIDGPLTYGNFIAEHRERVSGRVEADGQGIEGISATLSDGFTTRCSTTDAQGHYFFYAPAGEYVLSFIKKSYLFSQQDIPIKVIDKEVNVPDVGVLLGVDFEVSPDSIGTGQSAALKWKSLKAASITIDQGIGNVGSSGSLAVSPNDTTTYTITAYDSQGRTITNQATLTVYQPPTASITANRTNITQGQYITLTWTSTNADVVTMEPDGWSLNKTGSLSIYPWVTTTYTVVATGLAGTARASVTVNVYPPPTASISASPQTINIGQSSTLQWNTTNAQTVTIDHGIGNVSLSGSLVVTPADTTTYTITATGPVESKTAQATVTVKKCTVTGIVADASSGLRLSGVSVKVSNSVNTLTSTTDVNGAFSVSGAICGNFTAVFEKAGYISKSVQGLVSLGGTYNIGTSLSQIPSLSLAITNPVDGATALSSPVTVTGSVSNNAQVSVNGVQATVAGTTFTASIPLQEGQNTIVASAQDQYGQQASSQITLTYHQPPPAVTITADPVSITAGQTSHLTWTSEKADAVTIDQSIGVVPLNGSLDVSPTTTMTYTITAVGPGGTANASVTVTVNDIINITIDSPLNGAVIKRPDILVLGTITNTDGNETGVTVNGIPAVIYGNQFVANHIPLQEGSNAITISAKDNKGHNAESTINVNAVTAGPYITLSPDDPSGVSPLQTTIRIDAPFTTVDPLLYSNGPGSVEFLAGSTTHAYISRMTVPGVYYFTASVLSEGQLYSDTIGIIVSDQAETDSIIRTKWDGMKSSLINSDITGALEYFALPSQDEYQKVFTRLSSELSAIAAGMEDIEQVYIRGNVAKYRIKKDEVINGANYRITHYIYFVQDAYGHWYIDSF